MMRPGRLDKLLYVPVPDALGRRAILRVHCRRAPLADGVDLDAIADDARAEHFRCVCGNAQSMPSDSEIYDYLQASLNIFSAVKAF